MSFTNLADELSLRAVRLGKRLVSGYPHGPHHEYAIEDADSAVLCTTLTQVCSLLSRLEAQEMVMPERSTAGQRSVGFDSLSCKAAPAYSPKNGFGDQK